MADGIKMKLAVDRTGNRVLFADAGSDLVDVLLSFLTLPLSAVRRVAGASSPGCLSTLCQGISYLRASKLLRFESCHDMLLQPRHEDEFNGVRCLRHEKAACRCYSAIVRSEPSLNVDCRCWQVMARVAHLFNRKEGLEKFVKGNRRFVISDDLVIKPASTANTRSLLQRISTSGIGSSFEEIEVCVGWVEVVSMLKASFSSKTVFTDTFLSKETEVRATVNSSIARNIQHRINEEDDDSPQFSIKMFYDSHEKKVMYAECEHEFVDLLLSFLVYPVVCVIKNFAGTSHLGCSLDNLYRSAVNLHANSLLAGHADFVPLIKNSKRATKKWFCLCSFQNCPSTSCIWTDEGYTCSFCSPQFVDEGTYIVDDDLQMYQASAMLVMKHWCDREKASVFEMDIAISKQEALDLLRAVLTRETALTDVFKGRLEKRCQLSKILQRNHFQIFVKLHTGKTITLDVENHDTIATVKHKINEKAGHHPVGYSYRLVYGSASNLPDSSTIAACNIGKGSTVWQYVYLK